MSFSSLRFVVFLEPVLNVTKTMSANATITSNWKPGISDNPIITRLMLIPVDNDKDIPVKGDNYFA